MARILLVDDSTTIRSLIKTYLAGFNHELVEAADGNAALKIMRGGAPADLVICDVFMPGLDGIQFVRAIRDDTRDLVRTTPIIAASSRPQPEVERDALAAGANVFLRKPIGDARLGEVVRELLAKPRSR